MNKPLKDWTLGELKEYCNGVACEECEFYGSWGKCVFGSMDPYKWDLPEPSRWTAEDIEDAKAVKRVFKWATQVCRGMAYIYAHNEDGRLTRCMDAVLFPRLKKGESVTLQEILDAEEK